MRLLLSASLLALVVACAGSPPEPPPAVKPSVTAAPLPSAPIELSLVGTNDLHGRLEALPLLASYLGALRKHHSVLLVDAGDMFQGTLESNLGEGAGVVRAYNALGYDAAAIGNHEFDFGPAGPAVTATSASDDPRGALRERAVEAKFPFLSANVVDAKTGANPGWRNVLPSVIVEKSGVKIGLVGVTSEDTPRTTLAANFSGLAVASLATTLTTEAARLRARGATVVIAITHAGGKCTKLEDPSAVDSCAPKQEIMGVLAEIPEGTLDALVAGHTHQAMAHVIHGVPVIESWASGRAFGRIDFVIDGETKRIKDRKIFAPTNLAPNVAYEGETMAPEAAMTALLAPDMERARERKEKPVGVKLEGAITKKYDEESLEGNLFADLLGAAATKADVAIVNGGGLRADLPAGDLKYGALFEAMPFDNRLAIVKLKGGDLAEMVRKNLVSDKGILSFSGLRVVAKCAGSKLDVALVRKNGKTVKADETLVVATSDFLATGGDDSGLQLFEVKVESDLLRDIFEAQLKGRGKPVLATDPLLLDPSKPRFAYPGKRPVACAAP